MKKNLTKQMGDYLKANRKAAREQEIELFGKQVLFRRHISKSSKTYDRNNYKKFPTNE